jgi:hypothetical protein
MVALFMACDLLHRIFGDFRPVDYISCGLESIFIIMVLWLELPDLFHKRRVRKKVRIIQQLLLEGDKLRQTAPPADVQNLNVPVGWSGSVQAWIGNCDNLIADHSIPAWLAFTRRNVGPDVLYVNISAVAGARDWYRELLHRMNNLLNILENAYVYFEKQ